MSDTIQKNVSIRVTSVAGPEAGAAFKAVQGAAAQAGTAVQQAARAEAQALQGTAAAAANVGAAVEAAGKKASLSFGSVAKDLKALDKGLGSTITNVALLGSQMGIFDANGKIAKGIMALMLIKEVGGLFKGLALTAKAAHGSLLTYLSGAVAATAANEALAKSHTDVAVAAQAQAQAQQVASTSSVAGAATAGAAAPAVAGSRMPMYLGGGIGFGVGALAGGALAQQQGWGPWGTAGSIVGGGALGSAAGAGIGKAASWGIGALAAKATGFMGGAATGAVGGGGWLAGAGHALGTAGLGAGVGAAGAALAPVAIGAGIYYGIDEGINYFSGGKYGGDTRGAFRAIGDYRDSKARLASQEKRLGSLDNIQEAGEKARKEMEKRIGKDGARRMEREEAAAREIEVRAPFEDQQRALGLSAAGLQDEAVGLRGLGAARDEIEKQRLAQTLPALAKVEQLAPEVFKGAAGQEMLRGQREQLGDLAKGQAAAEAAAAKEVYVAKQGVARLTQEENQLRQQLAESYAKEKDTTLATGPLFADRQRIEQQLLQVGQQRREAEQGVTQAVQQQNQTKIQGLQQQQKYYAQQEQMFRNIAAQEAERVKGIKVGMGLSDDETIEKSLAVSRAIKGGQELSPEMLQFAKGQSIFKDALEDIGLKKAQADPRLQELFRDQQIDKKQRQAEEGAKVYADLNTSVQNDIKAEIKLNEESLAQQLTETLMPQVLRAVQDATKAMDTAWRKANLEQRMAKAAAAIAG